jgi:hypothetical protein
MHATLAFEHTTTHRASDRGERYALTPAQMHEQVKRLMREHPAPGNSRFAAYRIRGTNPFSNIARSIECEVFRRFFGNTPYDMHQSYGAYEDHSHFLLAVDRQAQQPAGTLRVIENSELGLKSLNDVHEDPLRLPLQSVLDFHRIDTLDRCWDVGTLAVRKPYRGEDNAHFVGTMLYGLFHGAACAENIDHAVAILDGHAYRQLTEMLAIPFEAIAGTGPFEYLGAKGTRAAYLKIRRVVPTVEKHMDRMDTVTRASMRPFLARVIYAEGLPQLVDVR